MNKAKIIKYFFIVVNLFIIIPAILKDFKLLDKNILNYFLDLPLPFFLFSVEPFPLDVSVGCNWPEISVAAVEI